MERYDMEQFIPTQKRLILVCCNTKEGNDSKYCGNKGSMDLHAELKTYVKEKGLQKTIRIIKSGCLDYCGLGPNVCIMPENVWLKAVSHADLNEIKKRWIDSII